MPAAVESALARAAGKLAASGKLKNSRKYKSLDEAKKAFTFGVMRNRKKKAV